MAFKPLNRVPNGLTWPRLSLRGGTAVVAKEFNSETTPPGGGVLRKKLAGVMVAKRRFTMADIRIKMPGRKCVSLVTSPGMTNAFFFKLNQTCKRLVILIVIDIDLLL